MWREIVLDETAYPRDRLEAWQRIGERAGILATAAEQREQQQPTIVRHEFSIDEPTLALLRSIQAAQAGQVADAEIVEEKSGDG